jgi:hypothetical protein
MTQPGPTRKPPKRLDPTKVSYWRARLERAEWSVSVWTRLLRQDERDLERRRSALDERGLAEFHERIEMRRRHRDRALDGTIWALTMLDRYDLAFAEDFANGDVTRWEAAFPVHPSTRVKVSSSSQSCT